MPIRTHFEPILVGDTCGQIWGTKSATVRQQMHPKPAQGTENGNRSAENASKMRTVCTKMHPEPVRGHQKCQPFVKKCRPFAEKSSLGKLGSEPAGTFAVHKSQPFARKCVKNAYRSAEVQCRTCKNGNRSSENASKMRTLVQKWGS